jgi:hypothetical protein
MNTPDRHSERLLAFAAGELDPDEAREIEALIAHDRRAASIVARCRQVLSIARADDSVAPSAEAVARAKAIYRAPETVTGPGVVDRIAEVIASLVFDSRKLGLAGVRDAVAGEVVQLTFESELAEIDLRIEPATGDAWRIIGQVVGETCEPSSIEVRRAGRRVAAPKLDERGFFEVDLPRGTYELVAQTTGGVVRIPDVPIP